MNDFDHNRWRGGHWGHGDHDGRFGWRWVLGPRSWFSYSEPVYPYPAAFVAPGNAPGYWYWCEPYQAYYPFVRYCPAAWIPVPPH